MTHLIDSSLWIDLIRARSSRAAKMFVAPYVDDPQACLAEPIAFELLRHATEDEAEKLTRHFETLPLLLTPANLWSRAAELGRCCRKAGANAGSLDLLIAAVALEHDAELITFDADFQSIGQATGLRVMLLTRPKS